MQNGELERSTLKQNGKLGGAIATPRRALKVSADLGDSLAKRGHCEPMVLPCGCSNKIFNLHKTTGKSSTLLLYPGRLRSLGRSARFHWVAFALPSRGRCYNLLEEN
jgi:hypothetical protein